MTFLDRETDGDELLGLNFSGGGLLPCGRGSEAAGFGGGSDNVDAGGGMRLTRLGFSCGE